MRKNKNKKVGGDNVGRAFRVTLGISFVIFFKSTNVFLSE